MYIIFGEEAANEVAKTNLLLEVDTIRLMPLNATVKSYCVLENAVLNDSKILMSTRKLHEDLVEQYRAQNWKYCINSLKDLRGQWNGELDEFYDNLLERVQQYIENPPDKNWDYAVIRHITMP